jgi:hypothetical protein
MPKTYTAAGTVVAGEVYTAAAHNIIATDVNNFIVPPLCRVRRATTQSISNSTDTFVTFPIEDIDTDGMFTATSDTITIQTAGVYQVSASILFAANNTGARIMNIYKNPTSVSDFAAVFASQWTNATQTYSTVMSASGIASFTAGQTLKIAVFQTSGGPLNIGDTGFTSVTQLSAAWVGQTS